MRLTTELTVEAPLAVAWPALLELGGPVTFDLDGEWSGSARLDDADEDEHTAGFHLLSRERGGPGTAAATIIARASGNGEATRIDVETDLRIAGPHPDTETAQRTADELLQRVAATLTAPDATPEAPDEPEPPALEAPDEPQPAGLDAPPEPAPEAPAEPEPEVFAEPEPEALAEPGPQAPDEEPAAPLPPPPEGPDPAVELDPVVLGGKLAERALLVVAGIALGLGLGRLLWWRRR